MIIKLIVYLLFFSFTSLYSQDFEHEPRYFYFEPSYYYGIKTSYSFNSIFYKNNNNTIDVNKTIKFYNGYSLGGYQQLNFHRFWTTRGEFIFSRFSKELKFNTEGIDKMIVNNRNTLYYINIPLCIFYNLKGFYNSRYAIGIGLINTFLIHETNSLNQLDGSFNNNNVFITDNYINHNFYNFKIKLMTEFEIADYTFNIAILQDFMGVDKSSLFELGLEISFLYRLSKFFKTEKKIFN